MRNKKFLNTLCNVNYFLNMYSDCDNFDHNFWSNSESYSNEKVLSGSNGYISLTETFNFKDNSFLFVLIGQYNQKFFAIYVSYDIDKGKIWYSRSGYYKDNRLNSEQIQEHAINNIILQNIDYQEYLASNKQEYKIKTDENGWIHVNY